MKWYFSMESVGYQRYGQMMKAAVASCRKNTTLDPILIWNAPDGSFPVEFYNFLSQHGVQIICHNSQIHDLCRQIGIDNHVIAGSYLRYEVPQIEQTDEFVLYTDVDVIFTGDPQLGGSRPRYFSCAPEFDPNYWGYFNSGIMLMNVPAMRATNEHLVAATMARIKAGFCSAYDQGDLNAFYFDTWDRLDLGLNWKPYWGINPDAKIIHFHGPKPDDYFYLMKGDKKDALAHRMIALNPEAYKHYVCEYVTYVEAAGEKWTPKLFGH